ncbi:AbrB/MazE/SpoVT family DNA-binding domain-containing protein [Streptomyces sp. NRRL F-5126]|uniref:AbrB/MazE/SpoVT family DNA-binding domain-containing protein n=1 Tax=Streptomyces sp. NRRL F-5126 TaxID=1463857 RepID=UPI0004C72EF7|nr:AbrB/MazE/SpoVT family DNA-binding domain-containing protein [Streptomyces sp. NRRL F-5126]
MAMATYQTRMREKGQLTLPARVREALGVAPGDELEFEVSDAGTVEVHGLTRIRSDQAWFWTREWREGERQASEDIAAGRTTVHEDADAMFAHLNADD